MALLDIRDGQRREENGPTIGKLDLFCALGAQMRYCRSFPPVGPAKPLPPAHELAERIKTLKAAHTIEAAPQRLTAHSAARAEEPIAARIRHRVKDSATLPPGDDPVLPAAAAQPSPRAASPAPAQPGLFEVRRPPAPAKPRTFHQEHVSPDKHTPKRQMSLF